MSRKRELVPGNDEYRLAKLPRFLLRPGVSVNQSSPVSAFLIVDNDTESHVHPGASVRRSNSLVPLLSSSLVLPPPPLNLPGLAHADRLWSSGAQTPKPRSSSSFRTNRVTGRFLLSTWFVYALPF